MQEASIEDTRTGSTQSQRLQPTAAILQRKHGRCPKRNALGGRGGRGHGCDMHSRPFFFLSPDCKDEEGAAALTAGKPYAMPISQARTIAMLPNPARELEEDTLPSSHLRQQVRG